MRNAPARVSAPPCALRKSSGRWRRSRCGRPRDEVAAERLGGLAADRDDPLLVSLADAADEAVVERDRRLLERDGLGDAEAGAVEELDERAVAEVARLRAGGGLDQALGLARRERPRQLRPSAREVELGGRVVVALAEQLLVAEEGAQRRGAPRERRRREAGGAQLGEVALEVVGRRGRGRRAEERGEVREVAAVGVDRARRAPRREQREEPLDRRARHERRVCARS